MKKEYLILIFIIVVASLYLLFNKNPRDNFAMPEIKKIDTAKVSKIVISKNGNEIILDKKDNEWGVQSDAAGFPADKTAVEDMLDVFKLFRLTALASEKSDLHRYELDEKQKIDVTLYNGSDKVFELSIGKPAPTYNHTFVKIAGDRNIYHANGTFRSDFDKSAEDLKKKAEEKEEDQDQDQDQAEKKSGKETEASGK